MKILQIKPKDNLFLGGGKNFNKGESTWLSTRFVPYPSVFYGAICSLMLSLNDKRRKDYITNYKQDNAFNNTSDPRKYLTVGNVYLYNDKDKHYYIPAPLDVFYKNNNVDRNYISKIIKVDDSIKTSSKMNYLFSSPKNSTRCDGMFISLNTFYSSYYYGENDIDILNLNDITTNAYKVGIEKNENYTAKEGHLYRIDLTEFKDDDNNSWSYVVEYELNTQKSQTWWEDGKDHLNKGYLKLGGESKVCKYISGDICNYSIPQDDFDYEYVKLILMSPLVIKDENAKLKDIDIIAVSTGKYYSIGGFDLQLNIPKPMFNAFPEGSVFVLDIRKLEDRTIRKIWEYVTKEEIFRSQGSGFGKFRIVPLKDELILS
ncbi:type III-B CRISPR module-associated Cmr3 family protein [Clostridium sp.]|uniref:type III-B CRISPR module-associated Cmr3 family protein n=1 Tax=Clostridium sp. TaxID=1506 RepID=UPI002FDD65C7